MDQSTLKRKLCAFISLRGIHLKMCLAGREQWSQRDASAFPASQHFSIYCGVWSPHPAPHLTPLPAPVTFCLALWFGARRPTSPMSSLTPWQGDWASSPCSCTAHRDAGCSGLQCLLITWVRSESLPNQCSWSHVSKSLQSAIFNHSDLVQSKKSSHS